MIVKAHAFGNDFVLVESRAVQGAKNLPGNDKAGVISRDQYGAIPQNAA